MKIMVCLLRNIDLGNFAAEIWNRPSTYMYYGCLCILIASIWIGSLQLPTVTSWVDWFFSFPAFATLLKSLWKGGTDTYVSPTDFKSQIARFAKRFVGYKWVQILDCPPAQISRNLHLLITLPLPVNKMLKSSSCTSWKVSMRILTASLRRRSELLPMMMTMMMTKSGRCSSLSADCFFIFPHAIHATYTYYYLLQCLC